LVVQFQLGDPWFFPWFLETSLFEVIFIRLEKHIIKISFCQRLQL
jgi:hypothetical protein